MVYTRSKLKRKEQDNKTVDPPTTVNIFKTLIAALEAPKGIELQLLRSSYYLLIQLSSKQQLCLGKGADLNELFIKTKEGEVRLSLRDLYALSKILFMNLQKRLKQLQSLKHDICADQSHELEELNLLMRCCMITLTLNVPQEHLLRSGRVLLQIFKKLSLLEVARGCHETSDYENSLSCQCMYSGDDSADSFLKDASVSSLQIFDHCIPSITTILEVLFDELLVHARLRKYLHTIDFISPVNERLFKNGANSSDFGVTMELIYSHFLLSVPDEGALQEFLKRIPWGHSNSKSLELSVIAARTLLQNPVVLSSPKLLQSHIVSVASDVIGVGVHSEKPTSDPTLIDCYLSVFESSVILYTQHISFLETENKSPSARDSLSNIHNKNSQASLMFRIDSTKRLKLDQKITMLNDSWISNLRGILFKQKSDLLASSIEYLQQNLCILDVSCRDDIFSFLKCMLMRAANNVNNVELSLNGDASLQDICLLASLLMLMSNSLIQTVWCQRYHSDQQRHNECKFIVGIINCFKDFSIRLPIQKISGDMMATDDNELRLMLIHFLGLLSLSFDGGIDFLVMSCVSVIMALTNLFVLKDGNVDALRSLADPGSLLERSLVVYEEPPVCRHSTLGVAANFQKIRTLFARDVERSNASAASDCTPTEAVGAENSSTTLVLCGTERALGIEESCSGETYLKTRLKSWGDVADFDDLADFVECKKGKNYARWLKDRDKFRLQKLRKRVKHRWEKKKQAYRSIRGKSFKHI